MTAYVPPTPVFRSTLKPSSRASELSVQESVTCEEESGTAVKFDGAFGATTIVTAVPTLSDCAREIWRSRGKHNSASGNKYHVRIFIHAVIFACCASQPRGI